MIKIRYIIFSFLLILPLLYTPFLFLSCKEKIHLTKEKNVQKKELSTRILFVFGKDFFMYADLFAHINDYYDSASLKKNISIISYTDMTAKTKQPRFSLITEYLAARPTDVLITVGIPEGGARILRTIKENYPALAILTLLPVEEILPLEAYSTLVADFALPDALSEVEKPVEMSVQDLQMLMLAAVLTADQMSEMPEQTPYQRFSRAFNTALSIAAADSGPLPENPYTVKPYKDPELNIYSFNYFIVSREDTVSRSLLEEHSGD